MDDLSHTRFTHHDEWILPQGKTWLVGITDYAQDRIGDIVRVDLPEPDEHRYEKHDEIGVVESLTGSMEIHAPASGIITEINTKLLSNPELINLDPYEDGWIVRMKPEDPRDFADLMDAMEYESGLPEEEEE